LDEWIDELARALGEGPMEPKEMGAILKMARDVAHGVDRKMAPLSTFLVGVSEGRRVAEGSSRESALADAIEAARALIPAQAEPG